MKEVDPPLVDPDGAGPLAEVRAPLYCSGQTLLPSGAVLAAGGNLIWPGADPDDGYGDYAGADIVYTFDPYAETWVAQARMSGGRWYPSQVRLADGRTAILGGFDENAPGGSYADTVEIFTPANEPGGLGQVSGAGGGPQFLSALYPHLTTDAERPRADVGPGGGRLRDARLPRRASRVDHRPADRARRRQPDRRQRRAAAGGAEGDVAGDPARRDRGHGPRQPRGTAGSAALRRDGDIGDNRRQERPDQGGRGTAEWPRLRQRRAPAGPLDRPDRRRQRAQPDRGQLRRGRGRQARPGPRSRDEHLDAGPSQREFRTYHSVAVLLPDGRVFSAGDDYHSVEAIAESPGYYRSSRTDTAEIYEPAYLFAKASGRRSRGRRSGSATTPTSR